MRSKLEIFFGPGIRRVIVSLVFPITSGSLSRIGASGGLVSFIVETLPGN